MTIYSCECPNCGGNGKYLGIVNFNDLESSEENAEALVEGSKFPCSNCGREYQYGIFDVTDNDLSPALWEENNDL